MHLLNHSMLKSNSLERISGELLTRSFSYSVLQTYMPIPTKFLLSRFQPHSVLREGIYGVSSSIPFVGKESTRVFPRSISPTAICKAQAGKLPKV